MGTTRTAVIAALLAGAAAAPLHAQDTTRAPVSLGALPVAGLTRAARAFTYALAVWLVQRAVKARYGADASVFEPAKLAEKYRAAHANA